MREMLAGQDDFSQAGARYRFYDAQRQARAHAGCMPALKAPWYATRGDVLPALLGPHCFFVLDRSPSAMVAMNDFQLKLRFMPFH
jgi:hypothetical protein